jgi:hypothetical protein
MGSSPIRMASDSFFLFKNQQIRILTLEIIHAYAPQLHDFLPKNCKSGRSSFCISYPVKEIKSRGRMLRSAAYPDPAFFIQHFQVARHNTCKKHNIFRGFSYSSAA